MLDPIAITAVSISLVGLAGGIVYSYGRLAARVEAMEQRHLTEITRVDTKLDTKADTAQVVSLHADVREIREILLNFVQRSSHQCPWHSGEPGGV